MEKKLTIIPCRFDGSDTIINCVNSVRKFVDSDIVVIDSDSENKNYAKSLDAEVCFVANRNYDIGAYLTGFKLFPHYDNYICVHDSFTFNSRFIPNKSGFTPFRTFETREVIGGGTMITGRRDAIKYLLSSKEVRSRLDFFGFDTREQLSFFSNVASVLNLKVPKAWNAVFGPIFTADNDNMNNLSNLLKEELLPKNKIEQMAFERILGLIYNSSFENNRAYWGAHFLKPLSDHSFTKIVKYRL